jgi:hypothetical protein
MPTVGLVNAVVTAIAANTPYAIPPGAYRVLALNALTYATTFGGGFGALTGATAEPGALVVGGFIQCAVPTTVVIKKINPVKRNIAGLVGKLNTVAYWRQNEQFGSTFYDSINQQHMTKPAGITLNQPGIVSTQLSALYDGASSASVVADPLLGATALSVECIVNNPAWAAGHEMCWSNAASATYASFDTGKPIMSLRLGGLQFFNRANSALSPNTWYHVAYTWNTGEPIRLYVNGAEVPSEDLTARAGSIAAGGTMYLGSFGGASLFFSGYMADVAVYSKRLLPYEVFERAQARLSIW